MKVRYIYSASIEIETRDLKILCDPWFTDGIYHWNNADVGSMFFTKRKPDVFNRKVQQFLNFFSIY